MANILDWLQSSGNKLYPQGIEAFFTKQAQGSSPLEQALAIKKQQNLDEAVTNFNANRRSPGMAEAAIPGVEPTDLSATQKTVLDFKPWLRKWEGDTTRGRYRPELASMRILMNQEAAERQQASEQKAIMVLVASNPKYFTNRPPESFISKKEAEDFLKFQKDFELKGGKLGETIRHNKTIEAGKNPVKPWAIPSSTGTGGGTAPAISPQDKAAFDWARQNPNDPRATGILLKLKQKGL